MVVLRVADNDVASETVSLGSNRSKKETARRWAERFCIDYDKLYENLGKLALGIVAQQSRRAQEHRKTAEHCTLRITDVAEACLIRLALKWHEGYTVVYSGDKGRKIKVTDLWRHHLNSDIDRVSETVEALRDGPLTHAQHVNLFKNAILVAAEAIIARLPDIQRSEIADPTLDRENLIGRISACLIQPRVHRETNSISQSILNWAFEIEPSTAWLTCYSLPVAGRFQEGERVPEIAVKLAWLTQELRYCSAKRLATDLRGAKLAETDKTIRLSGRTVWRVAIISPVVVESSQTREDEHAIPVKKVY